MTLRKKVASALSFAHLTGLAKADQDDDKKKDLAADESDKKDDDDDKDAKKAEDKKDDESAEGDDLDDSDDDKKKSKKAKAEDDETDAEDDDKDDEMRGKSASALARRRERARCATIFGSKAAAKNPALAANLAFNTTMTRKEALVVLENSPSAASNSDRSSRNPQLGAGSVSQGNSPQAASNRWDAAFKKVAPRR